MKGKNIIIGVCGSIAAYKIATLTRLLVKGGANVQIIMTQNATRFITPLTLSTLSQRPVYIKDEQDGQWINHVNLALWADLILIAPASSNTIARLASGISDNLLAITYLSARCKTYIAPAMDEDMWKHPATKNNIRSLISFGNIIIPPGEGHLASGLNGPGRMAETEQIYALIEQELQAEPSSKSNILCKKLTGKKILVTGGPTHEAIDPVRFICNHSSGKMGFSLAEACSKQGAEVTLISGPSSLTIKQEHIKHISITSADEMHDQAIRLFPNMDICIMSAAVSDYKPRYQAEQKIKKSETNFHLELIKTPDILLELGKLKTTDQLLVGFALETENELENAKLKLKNKNLDLIVLNSLNDVGAGFSNDTNKVTLIDKNDRVEWFDLKTKEEAALDIINKIISLRPS